ncbi:MAG: carboxypeptidase-like regulatory domain-containing protein [Acidobacteriaceae bacterium]
MVSFRFSYAQSGTSSAISGTVTDASGAVVPNASVTATDVDTEALRTGLTDANGYHLFSQVTPGTYQLRVQMKNFAPVSSEPTPATVGRTAGGFRWHSRPARTVPGSAQRLSNGMRWMLRSIILIGVHSIDASAM